jgi:hypothetical protein
VTDITDVERRNFARGKGPRAKSDDVERNNISLSGVNPRKGLSLVR